MAPPLEVNVNLASGLTSNVTNTGLRPYTLTLLTRLRLNVNVRYPAPP